MQKWVKIVLTVIAVLAITISAIRGVGYLFLQEEPDKTRQPERTKPKLRLDSNKTYFFVDGKRGNDENPGIQENPWKTLTRASKTEPISKGTIVIVKQGTYHEALKPQHSGKPDAPLEFAAYPGHKVILDGQGKLEKGIDLSNRSYTTVRGFTVTGFTGNGAEAMLKEEQSSIQILNCIIYSNGGHGIYFAGGSKKTAIGCITHDNGKDGIRTIRGIDTVLKSNESYRNLDEDGIYFGDYSGVIENNIIHDQLHSTNPTAHIDGIQLFQHEDDVNGLVLIARNTFYRIHNMPIMLENYRGVRIVGNTIYKSNNNGINIKASPGTKIIDNLIYRPRYAGLYIHKQSTDCQSTGNIIFEAGEGNGWASYGINEDSIAGFSSEQNLLSKAGSDHIAGFGKQMVDIVEWQQIGFDKRGGNARDKKRSIEARISGHPDLPKK
ncbi:MAG: right-handed parallel beta-helix repeat-containing protein [Actinobacteria bacterium]|nr:right-handed parallel beta-helix repeat-containing protein [Actinomycetota bacterium]